MFFVLSIYMPHHARMCMFGRSPLGLLGVNNVEAIHLERSS